ncbi:SET and MYND domain-containing protein 4-like [Copidosoma floridanum]|uniref:SET and MYND domain-containing protein 4-like n=1 Tax=Copidosoma floridanum TaxID=29053 RepID=UPI0006C9DF05|nr:SET and MYND domain-containing protein 4-like [Copidosoma floridanum]
MSLDALISSLNIDEVYEPLEKKTDFASRVSSTLKALEKVLPLPCSSKGKNNNESVMLRKEADAIMFKQKGRVSAMLEAREVYSKSIAVAEQYSIALARAHANRSSALFHLYKYEECIRDVEKALEGCYPEHLRPNLLARKAKCLKRLGQEDVDDVCEEARILLESLDMSDEVKEKLETRIDNVSQITEIPKLKETSRELPGFVPHPYIPSASEAIDLTFDENVGRHYVAARDIKPGECLVVEKPYVMYLDPSNIYTHCSHCLKRMWDSIPCENCIYAMYCSEECKNDAWEQYHDIECFVKGYFMALKAPNLEMFSLKLTLLAVREYGSIENLRRELGRIDDCQDYLKKSYSDDGIFYSDKYRPLYTLVTHECYRKKKEIIMITLYSAILLFYIDKFTNLFGNSNKGVTALCENKDALFFAQQYALNYMKIQLNNHEVAEIYSHDFLKLGAVVGPVSSFISHSCNPNATRCPVFIDNAAHQVLFALQPIPKGAQVVDDYGCHFARTPKAERDEILSLYYFTCNCEACEHGWSLQESLPSIFSFITDSEEKLEIARALIHCEKWKKPVYEKKFEMSEVDPADIFKDLINSITKMYEIKVEPSHQYYSTLELFRYALNKYYGRKFEL